METIQGLSLGKLRPCNMENGEADRSNRLGVYTSNRLGQLDIRLKSKKSNEIAKEMPFMESKYTWTKMIHFVRILAKH